MTPRSLRDELSTGRPLLGAWLQTPNPVSAEAAGLAGFDWVGIDTQHGLIGYHTLLHMLQAVAISGTPSVVRVSGNLPGEIGRALDSGAQGVIVPLVETAEEAARAASACRYPPRGTRSWVRYGPPSKTRSTTRRWVTTALDVYEPEPPPPGTILTPHFAFSSDKSMERMSMDWVTQLWDLLHGRDAPVVTPGSCGHRVGVRAPGCWSPLSRAQSSRPSRWCSRRYRA